MAKKHWGKTLKYSM